MQLMNANNNIIRLSDDVRTELDSGLKHVGAGEGAD